MRMYDLITKKKQGFELTSEEIQYMILGYTNGEIPDYQMSAMTMAICFQGMSPAETKTRTWVPGKEPVEERSWGTSGICPKAKGNFFVGAALSPFL